MKNLILLISDDGVDRPLRQALTKTAPNFRIELADRRAAIEALSTPTVILLDLTLSQEPAFEVLRWLRTGQQYKQIPVFALAPRSIDVEDAYALGANSCLQYSPEEGLEPIAHGIAAYASLVAESGDATPRTIA